MKKKLFTLLTLLLAVCSGAWADETIFSYTIVQDTKDNFSTTTDDSWNDYDATGGTFSLYYKSGKSSVARDGDTYYYNFGGGAASIKLTLSSGTFKTGDIVTVSFRSNSGSNDASFKVRTAKGSSTNELTSVGVSSTQTTKSVTLDANFNSLSSIFIERTSQGMHVFSVTVTRPVTHSVSAVTSTGTDTYGTISAASTTVAEGGTTTITAVPASGYKVTNWAVSGTGASISPEGASNSTTTTLTMGTADATVTVTFGAAGGLNVTHTLTNVTATSGDTGDDAVSEGSEYTAVFAANSGYVLPEAITVTIGGETATAGTAYTWNKATGTVTIGAAYVTGAIVITVTGEAAYTLTYDANGGTGSMDNTVSKGSITLTANAYTKSGYTFMGWATSQALADAGTVAYADGAAYTLSADATLYAVWAENDYSFAPTLSSGTLSSGDVVVTSTGGKMVYTPADGGSPSLKYSTTSGSNCIEFGGAGQCQVTVTLDKVMQAGTVITLNYYIGTASTRGFYLANSSGTNKATFSQSVIGTYTSTYTVVAGDGLAGSNKFLIKRYNNAYLNSLTVINCDDKYAVSTLSGRNYASCVTSRKLDFASVEGITAYIATGLNGAKDAVVLSEVDIVPAGTAIIVKTDTKGATVNVPVTTADPSDVAENLLMAGDGTTAYNGVAGKTIYYLASDQFHLANDGTLQSGKAYLAVPTAGARNLSFVFDNDATGINASLMNNGKTDNEVYNLAGQRVAQPTKGLYIVNGKKVVIK